MPHGKKVRNASPRVVPYAKGFRCPTLSQKQRAIGCDADPVTYNKASSSFGNIPACTSIDDWLAQYDEDGQTYKQFLEECPWLSSRKLKYMKQSFVSSGSNIPEKYPDGVIYILPLGDFNKLKSPNFDILIDYAQRFLCLTVKQLPAVKLEMEGKNILWTEETFDKMGKKTVKKERMKCRYNAETGRTQLCIDEVLLKLKTYNPADALCLIALTMCDLYEARTDLFVAGMAAGNHRVAVFSLLRYDPNLTFSKEFWYEMREKKAVTPKIRIKLILLRSCRLLVHEICHLLGIDHCIFYACCMNGSGHLEEDFRQPMHLCPVDLRKLQRLCGFDVLERYNKLLDFFIGHEFKDEVEWMSKRIRDIDQNADSKPYCEK